MKTYLHFKKNEMPIEIRRMNKQDTLELHEHNFHELVIVFDGEGTHYTLDEKYHISQGDIFLIKPGTKHAYDNVNDLKIINLLYLPGQLNLSLYDLSNSPGYHAFFDVEPAMRKKHGFKSRLHLSREKLEYIKKLINSMSQELSSGKPDALFMTVSYFMQLIGFIARSYSKTKIPEQMDILYLSDIISYIEKNYQHSITIANLARKASMSEITLYRMFKKAFNMSPINYIISVRIARAQEMLNNSKLNISEIARETGFCDSNYFSRAFKKTIGISPRGYRKQQLNTPYY